MDTPQPEQWRRIPGHNYIISNHARILRIREDGTYQPKASHINKRTGHRFVVLYNNAGPKTFSVRSIVADLFLDPPREGDRIQFRDGDKTNCAASNLYWKSFCEIIAASYAKGERKPRRGLDLSAEVHEQVRKLWATKELSQIQIGKLLGISNSTVSKIVNGKTSTRGWRKLVPADPEDLERGLQLAEEMKTPKKGPHSGPLGHALRRAIELLTEDPTIGIRGLMKEMGISSDRAKKLRRKAKATMKQRENHEQAASSGIEGSNEVDPGERPAGAD